MTSLIRGTSTVRGFLARFISSQKPRIREVILYLVQMQYALARVKFYILAPKMSDLYHTRTSIIRGFLGQNLVRPTIPRIIEV